MKKLAIYALTFLLLALVGLWGGPIPRAVAKSADQISYFHPASKDAANANKDLTIQILISDQRLLVLDGEKTVAWSDVTTGATHSPTPLGQHEVLEKYQEYHSTLYDVEMPHALFLTDDGIAIHGGPLLTLPASGGCIRVPFDFARWLFPRVAVGTKVRII